MKSIAFLALSISMSSNAMVNKPGPGLLSGVASTLCESTDGVTSFSIREIITKKPSGTVYLGTVVLVNKHSKMPPALFAIVEVQSPKGAHLIKANRISGPGTAAIGDSLDIRIVDVGQSTVTRYIAGVPTPYDVECHDLFENK